MTYYIENETKDNKIAVLSFYSFIYIPNIEILLPKILLIGKKKYVKGTVLLANEGFNGSISGSLENVQLVLSEIIKYTAATEENVNIKINYCSSHPFEKLKVKLKKEIIAMNIDNLDVNKSKGEYIEPENWDAFILQDDVIVIDTRNNYEVEIGTFEGAIDPNTNTFKDFPQWVKNNEPLLQNKKIAMYCTGGIRCEKSTAYLKQLGFNNVYHLRGGILQYLQDTKNKSELWKGECFVFDNRCAVLEDLSVAHENIKR